MTTRKQMEREARKIAQRQLKQAPTPFIQEDINRASIFSNRTGTDIGMTRCYRNNRYCVMVFDNMPTSHGPAIKVMVKKNTEGPIPLHWSEMYRIKNEIFGYEMTAVEYYPAFSELVDMCDLYWFWIYPKGVLPIPILLS